MTTEDKLLKILEKQERLNAKVIALGDKDRVIKEKVKQTEAAISEMNKKIAEIKKRFFY